MFRAEIDPVTCDRSAGCPVARMCPRGAVSLIADGPHRGAWQVDADRCTGCGVCVRVCPTMSVHMEPKVPAAR